MNILKKFNLFLLIFLFTSSFVFSQGKTDEERLKDLDELVNKTLQDWKVPGVGVAIIKNGKVILTKGYGFRDVEGKLPVTENTLFAIGSCTKAFTAMDNCILVDRGLLNLDKPVINYMPNFRMYNDYVTMNMTARDLLTHRSGLPRHELVWYGADLTRQEIFDRLKFLEPSAGFREKYQYQNMMYMTAGVLVEAISKTTWEDFTRQNIFIPLEMNSTNFSTIESRRTSDYAKPYKLEKDKVKLTDFRDIQAVGPAGSINSNVKDMANWVIMHLNNGRFNGKKVVGEEMVLTTRTPQIVIPGPMSKEVFYSSYGLGWSITQYRDHLRVDHGGNIDGFSANVCLLPNDSLGIVVLTNMDATVSPNVIRNSVIDRMLELETIDWNARLRGAMPKDDDGSEKPEVQKDPNQIEGTSPTHALIDYVGNFQNEAYGTMKIVLKDDNLLIDYHTLKIPLAHYHYDYFKSTNEDMPPMLINFTLDEKGNVSKLSAQLEQGVKDIEFKRIPEYMNNSSLEKFTGEYEMQGMIAKVSVKSNTLKLFIPGQPEYDLIPTKENNFDIKDLKAYSVTFNLDSSGNITEIQFNQPNGTFKAKKK